MDVGSSEGSEARFAGYVEALGVVLGHADRQQPMHDYCLGLLMPIERKSVEPMAAVTAPGQVAAKHQSLLHFVGNAPWSDAAMLAKVGELVLPNQVWAADITYIPMQQGFLYLVAIIDWATRRVLSWRLSNTLTAGFCVEALSEALARFGKPDIFNTDQGAQFTSDEFTNMLRDHRIEISMDGRGRCHDNIFVERLWWTVKHEWVYLRPAANGIEQKRSLGAFFDWYNLRRPHQALGWRTPDEAYLGQSTAARALAA